MEGTIPNDEQRPAVPNKSHATLKQRLGAVAYHAYMAEIGARGGKKKVKKGLAVTGLQYKRPKRVRKENQDGSQPEGVPGQSES